MKQFEGKVVLITGASSGFGEEAAKEFAQQGAKLILMARRYDRLKKLAASLSVPCLLIEADVRDCDLIASKTAEIEAFGIPDILINNAGLSRSMSKVWETDLRDWNEMLDTNVKGLLNVTKVITPLMLRQNRGLIINVGSTSSHGVYPGGGVYCASKYAVRAITDTLRLEFLGTPLKVSLISPGMAKTEFSKVRFHGNEEQAEKTYEGVDPLTPADVVEAMLFIATRPEHVNVGDLILYSKSQASSMNIYRRPK